MVLTVNGKAEAVVLDAEAFQRLAERAEMMTFLQESHADIAAGRTTPAVQALDKLAKKHKLADKAK